MEIRLDRQAMNLVKKPRWMPSIRFKSSMRSCKISRDDSEVIRWISRRCHLTRPQKKTCRRRILLKSHLKALWTCQLAALSAWQSRKLNHWSQPSIQLKKSSRRWRWSPRRIWTSIWLPTRSSRKNLYRHQKRQWSGRETRKVFRAWLRVRRSLRRLHSQAMTWLSYMRRIKMRIYCLPRSNWHLSLRIPIRLKLRLRRKS